MTTKEHLVNNIKEWIHYDNEIKKLKKEVKIRKEKQKKLTDDIVKVMKAKEIDCFDLNDGKLIYSQSRTKQTINKQHIMNCLEKYFKENGDENMITDLTNFILENREIKIKETIRRKIEKNIEH
jgi:hypothetical protein